MRRVDSESYVLYECQVEVVIGRTGPGWIGPTVGRVGPTVGPTKTGPG